MEELAILFLIALSICVLAILFELVSFLGRGRSFVDRHVFRVAEFCNILVAPFIYLATFDAFTGNNCCSDTALFSPDHRLTIYTVIAFCLVAYFISIYRKQLLAPLMELMLNTALVIGLVLNIFIAIQIGLLGLFGNLPIIALFIIVLIKNHHLLLNEYAGWDAQPMGLLAKKCRTILASPAWVKYPVLLVLSVPVLILLSVLLLVFGQQPDSLISAFTQTYKQGFSELDHLCDNVQCGGHYLCSVAAKGHKSIVRPKRIGIRNGELIICNRQLLVSNAFEELVAERNPRMHRLIRRKYDRVGDLVHRHYHFFKIKLISDIVYVLMKPLELFFLIVLYLADKKPENRIERQYLSPTDKQKTRSNFF